jgi:APA family basic amino acid/polyamine antiporter
VVGEYTTAFVPALDPQLRAILIKVLSVAILVFFAVLQWRGVKWGSGAQLLTSALKTAALVVLIFFCFLLGGHLRTAAEPAHPPPALLTGWPLLVGFLVSLQAVIYTVDGWDGVIYFGEEVRNPGRVVPRAIFGSVLSVLAIYLLLNAAVLYVLPIGEISGNIFALGAAANRVFGWLGDPIIRSIMIVSLLSCINACQMFATRVVYAMSCDRLFFWQASRVNAGGTPVLALLLSTAVGITFVLGSFERVIAMLSFFFVANYTLSYTSLFVLRRREPQLPRPYRAWGYPWTTGAALMASAVFLGGSLWADRSNAPLAFALLIVSYPVYLILRWVSRRTKNGLPRPG